MKTIFIIIFIFIFSVNYAHGATDNAVDLIWEGETYTPAFYAGRPLPSAGNLVRVAALPYAVKNGRRLSSNQLIFNWIKDQNPIQSASGRGKDVLEYRAETNGAPSVVRVEVSTVSGERLAEARVPIPTIKPKLIF